MRSRRPAGARVWRRAAVWAVPVSILAGALASPASATVAGPDIAADVTTSASATLHVGDSFDYTISVQNQGDRAAHGVVLSNDLPRGLKVTGPLLPPFAGGDCSVVSSQANGGVPAYSVYCERADLPAGEASAATFTVVVTDDVTCGTVENAVDAKASNEPSANTANNTASVSVDVGCAPSIALTKHAPSFARVGDRITFTLRATNSGRIALNDLRVADPGCGSPPSIVANGNGDETLDPHEVWVYRCGATITSATPRLFSTTATVTGHSPDGTARGSARATVRVAHPRVAISVTATPVSGSPGDVITYTYVVRNRGDVALSDLIVTDDRLAKIGVIAQLSPGHSATLRATRELSATDVWVVNTATVIGVEPSGGSVTASANAAISLVAATSDGTTGTGSGGTAFTGSGPRTPAALGLFLGLLGLALVVGSRRRA